tara:strand:+ start:209 stop:595 length:387 start_codon:yes stop_codon:yes gene_type:complete
MSRLAHSNPYFDDVLTDIDIQLGVIFSDKGKNMKESYNDKLFAVQLTYREWDEVPRLRKIDLCMSKSYEAGDTWDAFMHTDDDHKRTEALLVDFVRGNGENGSELLAELQKNVVSFYEDAVHEDLINL